MASLGREGREDGAAGGQEEPAFLTLDPEKAAEAGPCPPPGRGLGVAQQRPQHTEQGAEARAGEFPLWGREAGGRSQAAQCLLASPGRGQQGEGLGHAGLVLTEHLKNSS